MTKSPYIDLAAPVERALLIGAPIKRLTSRDETAEHLEELGRLADTAGAVVVGEVIQHLDRAIASTYLGSGKIEEVKQLVQQEDISLLIFDDELSPSQGKNIEELTGVRIMDRAELILDIFATRARSSEAKMQVELAQLQYMLPRLTRMWTHLEKIRGGIGMRGPGETQLETDRRLINHRIKILKQRLADTVRSRAVRRSGRRNQFGASLVGYTNAGKSSILRALTEDQEVFVEDRLFATLDPLTRQIDLGEGQLALLTDTVGFVRKLPHQLVASFRATLEEVTETDLLIHVIDVSNPVWEEQRNVVNQVLAELGVTDKPTLNVFNKIDLVPKEELAAIRDRIDNLLPGSVFVSSLDTDSIEPLRRELLRQVRKRQMIKNFHIPVSEGQVISELYRKGEVISQDSNDEVVIIQARVGEELAGRLSRYIA